MRNLNVAVRLGFSFGLVLFLMMVAVGMALYAIRDAQHHASEVERENLAMLTAANAMRGAQLTEAVAIRDFVGQTDVERQTAAFQALNASEKAYAEAAGQLEILVAGEDADSRLRALVAKLKQANAPITAKLRDAMQLSDQAEYAPAQAIVYDQVRPLQAAIAADLEALVAASDTLARQRAEAGRARAHRTELLLVAVALAALALGIAATWIITRGIARPLAFAVKVVQRVAEGDLRDMAIRARRNDETGRVLVTLAGMQGRLGVLVRAIRESADAVGGASGRISARNTELAARTEEQAASLEETAASVEELTAVVKQNADSAGKASELASEASTLAQHSGEAVAGVRQRMERIQKSSRNVSEIVGVMDEIAFQTNLLALNAAVEAARAGEHGRGFGVVAAQVRALAQRSGEAARDIRKLVAAAVGEADHGARAAEGAGASMARVVQVAHDLARLVSDIARGSEEQRAGIEQVNTTIAQMDTATQSNAALVQEINDFIDGLLAQARELAQATSRFRLDATDRADAAVAVEARGPAAMPPLALEAAAH